MLDDAGEKGEWDVHAGPFIEASGSIVIKELVKAPLPAPNRRLETCWRSQREPYRGPWLGCHSQQLQPRRQHTPRCGPGPSVRCNRARLVRLPLLSDRLPWSCRPVWTEHPVRAKSRIGKIRRPASEPMPSYLAKLVSGEQVSTSSFGGRCPEFSGHSVSGCNNRLIILVLSVSTSY